ncbi:MAG TPA: radical SAM protein [Candidatus Lokiarchaeia archaeon]|nr:radical SAM protein [Candidatus Lokiarchaeia archaeon]
MNFSPKKSYLANVIFLKVVLIFPNTRRHSIFYPSIHQPSLGLAYLAAMIKNEHDVLVIDAAAEDLDFKQIFKRIEQFRAELIGISTNVSIAYTACELALRIKIRFPGMILVMGGPWATVEYSFIFRHRIADYVVLGEGEYVFKEFLHRLENDASLDDLKGISFKKQDGTVIANQQTEFIQDLDALPYPAWEYFPSSTKYFTYYRHRPFFPIMITRGCPYGCIHCTKIIHGYKIRKRSIENVIGEMKYLKEKFKAKEFIITDDNFTLDVKYAERILDEIVKARLNVYIAMPNGVRADTLSPKLLAKMKLAGVYSFAIGVESGVQYIVNKIGKNLDLEKVRYAAKLKKKYGFLLRAFFILGLPYDSLDTMKQSIKFAKEIDPEFADFFIATLFPGTEMYDIVENTGVIEKKTSSNSCEGETDTDSISMDFGFYFKPVINFSFAKLKPGDVKTAYNIAVREFYFRPRKILSVIGTIKSIYEIEYILNFFLLAMNNVINGLFFHKP